MAQSQPQVRTAVIGLGKSVAVGDRRVEVVFRLVQMTGGKMSLAAIVKGKGVVGDKLQDHIVIGNRRGIIFELSLGETTVETRSGVIGIDRQGLVVVGYRFPVLVKLALGESPVVVGCGKNKMPPRVQRS